MSGPCFRAKLDASGTDWHRCLVMDPLHTGDHQCCCDYEWPITDEEWQETKRAIDRESA